MSAQTSALSLHGVSPLRRGSTHALKWSTLLPILCHSCQLLGKHKNRKKHFMFNLLCVFCLITWLH